MECHNVIIHVAARPYVGLPQKLPEHLLLLLRGAITHIVKVPDHAYKCEGLVTVLRSGEFFSHLQVAIKQGVTAQMQIGHIPQSIQTGSRITRRQRSMHNQPAKRITHGFRPEINQIV